MEIFAEGEHHIDRRILPLKKGFARIILGTLLQYPDLEIKIDQIEAQSRRSNLIFHGLPDKRGGRLGKRVSSVSEILWKLHSK